MPARAFRTPEALDQEFVADAQRRLGPAPAQEAIRAYLLQERPHLLKCYDLDTLVGLLRSAMERSEHAPAGLA